MRGRGHIFDDQEKLSRMLSLYIGGWRTTHLAEEFLCDHTSIIHQVKKNGVWHRQVVLLPARRPFYVKLSPRAIAEPLPTAPPPVMKRLKYEYVHEELARPGKSYKEYLQETERRDGAAKKRERLMERLRAEKAERDAKIAKGEIFIFGDYSDFNTGL